MNWAVRSGFVLAITGTVWAAEAQAPRKLSAPTLYIAARADFEGVKDISKEMKIKGASNLPEGSRIRIEVFDGLAVLNTETFSNLGKDGFFEATLSPRPGRSFRHNVNCDVTFTPGDGKQDPSVLQIVGRDGSGLGFLKNPQTYIHSGQYYMQESIHTP
jgi:hypothetical protein